MPKPFYQKMLRAIEAVGREPSGGIANPCVPQLASPVAPSASCMPTLFAAQPGGSRRTASITFLRDYFKSKSNEFVPSAWTSAVNPEVCGMEYFLGSRFFEMDAAISDAAISL